MFTSIWKTYKNIVNHMKRMLKQWTRPATAALVSGAISDLSRSRSDLVVENAMLRQQLIVLKRQVKRPQFTAVDQTRLTLLARLTPFWQSALHLVQPETLLCWHRDLFRWYWKRIAKTKDRKPRIPKTTIDLIQQMARENRLWGAERIRGELWKLGIRVGKPTIQKYMKQVRSKSGGQSWATFLKSHAHQVWACDFFVVDDFLFRPIYLFVIIAHKSREIRHAAVTRQPTDSWLAQQLREATPWHNQPRFLIRDNDKKFGRCFSAAAKSRGIKVLLTPITAPRANAICERLMGTYRRECLDHFLIFTVSQLQHTVGEFGRYYNQHRPHQGIEQCVPGRFENGQPSPGKHVTRPVKSTPILSGLHHHYTYTH